jgi:hypothetical protein
VLHVNLQDPTNLQQQEAVGVLGVNLIYAAVHHLGSYEEFLAGVFEDLSLERMEIDLVQLKGPAFGGWDQHKLHASLVTGGYAEAVAFAADGQPVPPTELIYKKALVLAPGLFDLAAGVHGKIIQTTLDQLPKEEVEQSKGRLGLFCLSSLPILSTEQPAVPEHLVHQAAELQRLGFGTMIFRAKELYTMSAYVSRYTKSQVYFAVGLSVMIYALQDRYKHLAGALLEGTARLFTQNVRLCVYPMSEAALKARLATMGADEWKYKVTNGMVYAEGLEPREPLNFLYKYLVGCGLIVSVHPPAA